MTTIKTVPRLSDDHLINICNRLKMETDNQTDFNLKLNEELKPFNITRNASVYCDSSGRIEMGMVFGMGGEVLNF